MVSSNPGDGYRPPEHEDFPGDPREDADAKSPIDEPPAPPEPAPRDDIPGPYTYTAHFADGSSMTEREALDLWDGNPNTVAGWRAVISRGNVARVEVLRQDSGESVVKMDVPSYALAVFTRRMSISDKGDDLGHIVIAGWKRKDGGSTASYAFVRPDNMVEYSEDFEAHQRV